MLKLIMQFNFRDSFIDFNVMLFSRLLYFLFFFIYSFLTVILLVVGLCRPAPRCSRARAASRGCAALSAIMIS